MKFSNSLSVQQTVSPNLVQYMEIMQLNTQELGEYLLERAMENPAIDVDLLCTAPTPLRHAMEQSDWLRSFRQSDARPADDTEERSRRSPIRSAAAASRTTCFGSSCF